MTWGIFPRSLSFTSIFLSENKGLLDFLRFLIYASVKCPCLISCWSSHTTCCRVSPSYLTGSEPFLRSRGISFSFCGGRGMLVLLGEWSESPLKLSLELLWNRVQGWPLIASLYLVEDGTIPSKISGCQTNTAEIRIKRGRRGAWIERNRWDYNFWINLIYKLGLLITKSHECHYAQIVL